MISLGLRYTFELYYARTVTLGVFENNEAALRCYAAAGFRMNGKKVCARFGGEEWFCADMEARR